MEFKTIDFILPDYWASYLINGDQSGYEERELKEIDLFCKDCIEDYGTAMFTCENDAEPSFCKYHDATYVGTLAADCITFTLLVEK